MWVLGEPGKAYAAYLAGGIRVDLSLDLPKGRYQAEWLNPAPGAVEAHRDVEHAGGRTAFASPAYEEDIALRIVAQP